MYSTLTERIKEPSSVNDGLVNMDWMVGEASTFLSAANTLVMLILCTLMREKGGGFSCRRITQRRTDEPVQKGVDGWLE